VEGRKIPLLGKMGVESANWSIAAESLQTRIVITEGHESASERERSVSEGKCCTQQPSQKKKNSETHGPPNCRVVLPWKRSNSESSAREEVTKKSGEEESHDIGGKVVITQG